MKSHISKQERVIGFSVEYADWEIPIGFVVGGVWKTDDNTGVLLRKSQVESMGVIELI